MKTQTTTSLVDDRVRDVYRDVLLAFAREPDFKEKGPGALIYRSATAAEPRSFTFGDFGADDEAKFHQQAVLAYEEFVGGRGTTARGLLKQVQYYAFRFHAPSGAQEMVVFYGWPWFDAQVFLLAFSTQLGFETPREARLTTDERNRLSPALRALLLK